MHHRAVIVATGPSAEGFVPPDDVTVIAVNGAISWLLDRADYWFSLDASAVNQRWAELAWLHHVPVHVAGDRWVSCAPDDAMHWHRVTAEQGLEAHHPYDSPEWWLARLQGVRGICKLPNSIHTGNSAWGALGLAFHLGFRRVALVGVDATSDDRVEGGTPGELKHLPLLFASALPDMDVVSCGRLDSIPQMTFNDWYNQ